MILRNKEKERAIALRKHGKSYREINAEVPVSKSSLSLWLRDVPLTGAQKERLQKMNLIGQKFGAAKRKQMRESSQQKIMVQAMQEIRRLHINKDALRIVGTALYWAEGSKQKPYNISQHVAFSNSDPLMLRLFVRWLHDCCGVKFEEINYSMYIHQHADSAAALQFWSQTLQIPQERIRVYFKKHNPKPFRRNIGNTYYGLVRIEVQKSTNLNRRITGWICGLCKHWGIS